MGQIFKFFRGQKFLSAELNKKLISSTSEVVGACDHVKIVGISFQKCALLKNLNTFSLFGTKKQWSTQKRQLPENIIFSQINIKKHHLAKYLPTELHLLIHHTTIYWIPPFSHIYSWFVYKIGSNNVLMNIGCY